MKRFIYTAVFGDYDRVYPPVRREAGVDYFIVTDQAGMTVPGWKTIEVDGSPFPTPKTANLHYRALIHRLIPGYDASLYIDGNIRLLGPTAPLFDELERSGAALALYAHPERNTLAEEAQAVIALGKVRDPAVVAQELEFYRADGLPEDMRLVMAGVIVKDHRRPELDPAMELWWSLYRQYLTRDQLSLTYILWKTGIPVHHFAETFASPNAYFALYPHLRGRDPHPRYAYVVARSYDSPFYWLLLKHWRGYWQVVHAFRQARARPGRRQA
jgi:hypothetical protein